MQHKKQKLLHFKLDETPQKAVDELKRKWILPPVLALPKSTGQFTVNFDASDGLSGCVLLHEQKD